MNRLTLITYPTSPATTVQFHYDYRGRRDYVIDQNNNKTSYAYDDADRLISVTDAQTPTAGVTTYAYDTESELTDIWDANQNHTHFDYMTGQLWHVTFPSGHQETYRFDEVGNPFYKIDRNGNMINYKVDHQNRVVQKSYPDSSQVNYTYDLAGRLTQVTDNSGTYSFGYDNMNRLTSATTNYAFLSIGNKTVAYGYDAASNRTSMTDPQNLSTSYNYDTLNRLSGLTNAWAGAFGFGYDSLSRRTSLTRPNGVNTSYTYDPVSRLLSVLHQFGSTTIDGASYTYDNAGNRLTKTDQRTSITSNYGYDNIYQLLQVTQGGSTTETYSYDKVGNRLSSLGVSPYSYNSSNELTSTPTLTYTFDNNGNTKSKSDGTQYTWDYENRLTQVVLPASGGTVNFKYDPFGRRAQKSFTQGSTTNYLYDWLSTIEELDPSGTVLVRYVNGLGIDEPIEMVRSGAASYFEADALGSLTSISAPGGSISNTYVYDAYGRQLSTSGGIVNTRLYAARDYDSETGLYYYRARYYDPILGRFLNEDPAGFSEGVDFYAYVGNTPVNVNDPSGLQQPNPVPGPVLAPPLGPVPVPPPPPSSIVDSILGYAGDILARTGGVVATVLLNPTPLNQDELDWQRQRDHDRYKDVCHGSVPEGPDECSTLSREINRANRCIALIQGFDARWTPSRHDESIAQWSNRVNELKDEYNRKCSQQKPQCSQVPPKTP